MKKITAESPPGRRILYVEEDDDSREMLALKLEMDGYAVSTAPSIAEALMLGKRERFDLYILDGGYNDGSGIDLCRQIRADDSVTPIIFYSGFAYPSDIEAGIDAGAQAYLTKPMGIYTICQTIAGLVSSPVEAQATAH